MFWSFPVILFGLFPLSLLKFEHSFGPYSRNPSIDWKPGPKTDRYAKLLLERYAAEY